MVQTKEERKIVARIYREKNKEHAKEIRDNNKDKIKEYYQNNKERIVEKRREYLENNKEKIREYKKQYIETPAGKKTGMMSSWRKNGVINVNDEMYNNYIATTHCECCLKEFSSSRDRCLDHDHETGEFRWVICQSCNNQDYWKKKINTHLVC